MGKGRVRETEEKSVDIICYKHSLIRLGLRFYDVIYLNKFSSNVIFGAVIKSRAKSILIAC